MDDVDQIVFVVILQHVSLNIIIDTHALSTCNGIEGKDRLFFCLVGGDRPEPIKDARPFIKFTSKSHSEFNNSRAITDASPKIVFFPPYLFVSIAGARSVGVEQRWWGNVPEHSSTQD